MAFILNPFTGQFDFTGGGVGATGPTGATGPAGSGGGGEPLSNGMLPFPELLFDGVTGDVVIAG